jgi:hypothetical protein
VKGTLQPLATAVEGAAAMATVTAEASATFISQRLVFI